MKGRNWNIARQRRDAHVQRADLDRHFPITLVDSLDEPGGFLRWIPGVRPSLPPRTKKISSAKKATTPCGFFISTAPPYFKLTPQRCWTFVCAKQNTDAYPCTPFTRISMIEYNFRKYKHIQFWHVSIMNIRQKLVWALFRRNFEKLHETTPIPMNLHLKKRKHSLENVSVNHLYCSCVARSPENYCWNEWY